MGTARSASNSGIVVSVRGSVVDIGFDQHLPPIYSVLRTGAERQIVIGVPAQPDARRVRGIALTPTPGSYHGHGQSRNQERARRLCSLS
jgi:F-type H+-transporting ATPase subunit beta